ncbi:MAG: rRNA pseudouridine synthase [Clostridia bacterium]|nr:rRNA pseudouridine synthase [Clostridia bacterium]
MRLDKLIANAGLASRSEISKAVRVGRVSVNGTPVKSPAVQVDPERDSVMYCGKTVNYREHIYIMLNKPEGYVSATEDRNAPVVTDLLLPVDAARVHPCGRLDKYTLGMMILTDDGEMSHRLLAPARHVPKTYRYKCESPLSESDEKRLCEGIHIEGGYLTKPCNIAAESEFEGEITIHEGKYHQIKQMFGTVGNKITYLERISFGPLTLDPTLDRGEWRYLTEDEIALLAEAAK